MILFLPPAFLFPSTDSSQNQQDAGSQIHVAHSTENTNSLFNDPLQQNSGALQPTLDSATTSLVDGQNFSHDAYTQSAFDSHSLNETAYQSDPFSTQDQWQDTSSMDGQSFSHDTYTQSAFDHNSLTETAYQSDQFSTENQWQQDTDSHSMPEHSLDQELNSLLNSVDSSHEHFHAPDPLEKEHEIRHAFSTPDSLEVHHYHHLVKGRPIDTSGYRSPALDSAPISGGNYSDPDYSSPSSDNCTDANGDGQCDSGSGSSNDND